MDNNPTTDRKRTVLIADDEKPVLRIMSRVLRSKNWTVLEASNGAEALSIYDRWEEPIDLLLLDVVMPGMDGQVTAQSIRARQPEIKVVYVSGFDPRTIAEHGVDIEAEAFLKKPFTVEELSQQASAAISAN